MFKAEIKSETLKGLVGVISTIVDEVKLNVAPGGIKLRAMDQAHVAMIELEAGAKAFESYSADEMELGVDLDKIKAVIKLSVAGDLISMELDEAKRRLVFKVGSITRSMSLIEPSGIAVPKELNLSLQSSADLEVDLLQKGTRASESISDYVLVTLGEDSFEMACVGDTDEARMRVDKKDLAGFEVPEPAGNLYPLDYFANVVKAIPSGTLVRLEEDEGRPLRIRFSMANGEVKVAYILAPRIEND
ncbi:MAG: DNA polymerase sliding clamp [Candidatus Methanoplasma sp.]|jgi:proliferating cell nuclear antigen|nr:DNA polymerase sliding clamp [Candidatus Methanoplasma sp.]